jgi:hypothetical protein
MLAPFATQLPLHIRTAPRPLMVPTNGLLRHLVLAVHRCLLPTPICEKGSNCQGGQTCDRTLRPKRLCQPPACPVFCPACLTSRKPWTCAHARICAQAYYANHLPTVKAMILSAITADGSDPGLKSLAGNRLHCGLLTICLLRHLGLAARRCLLTTPENGLNCQGAETCESTLHPRRLCQPPGCVAADGPKMSPRGPDCLSNRRPWTCVHTRLCARASYANRLPMVQAMMPMNLLTATTANESDPWAAQSWG